MKISLKCPTCGKVIQIDSLPNVEESNALCPHCQNKHKVGEFLPRLSLKVDGVNYQLRFGRQWVGRKKDGSDTEVQIPDETRYMSRRHAIVDIKCTQNGLRCTFEEHGKNPTSLQGIELKEDDIVYLNVNDCLQMGGKKMYLANEYQNQ